MPKTRKTRKEKKKVRLEEPATATWREDEVSDDDDLESSSTITGNLLSGPLDDPHNFRKACRKDACLNIITVGLMMGVILLGINARSHSKNIPMKTSLKDIIVVPQAPYDLSALCSHSRIRYQDGLAACQHACEPASCCMEEDEQLNCMSMSVDNEETCLEYSACLNVRGHAYNAYNDQDVTTTSKNEMMDDTTQDVTTTSKNEMIDDTTQDVTTTSKNEMMDDTTQDVTTTSKNEMIDDTTTIPSSSCEHYFCQNCLSVPGCVWTQQSCRDKCPEYNKNDGFDDNTSFSKCYSITEHAKTAQDVCMEEQQDLEFDYECEKLNNCEECLLKTRSPENGVGITCKWLHYYSEDDVAFTHGGKIQVNGRCKSSCSSIDECGVDVCVAIPEPPKDIKEVCDADHIEHDQLGYYYCSEICGDAACCFATEGRCDPITCEKYEICENIWGEDGSGSYSDGNPMNANGEPGDYDSTMMGMGSMGGGAEMNDEYSDMMATGGGAEMNDDYYSMMGMGSMGGGVR